jgi:hydrogenase nickel incorporation protein HypA/HybF
MHEASLVKSLLVQLATLVREHQAETAVRVHVQYGPLSGIEPELLLSAFEWMKREHGFHDCELELIWTPLGALCQACQLAFESNELRFDCPRCGSAMIEITVGEAILLETVELRFAETSGVSL